MRDEIYTEIILDLYKNPPNKGRLENADLEAGGGNPSCGDSVEFTLKIRDGKIDDIKFLGKGCAISIASESLLTEMVKGKNISETKGITQEQLFRELGDIIQTRIKCATLGLSVLRKGFEEYDKKRGQKIKVGGIVV